MSQTVGAVIPSYRPAEEPLLDLVATLRGQGLPVLVADDASPCTVDPVLRSAAEAGAAVVRHRRNAGIARSLNDGLRFAADLGATWLLTVDQDSTLGPDHVELLLTATNDALASVGAGRVGAVAAGRIDDLSGRIGYPVTEVEGIPTTPEVIQTGTLWAVGPLLALGGFDESFGIDAVDAAACVRLRASGRLIVLAPEVAVGHRIGEGRQVSVLGRSVLASGHSPARRTTIVRNRLRLAPEEFRQSPTQGLRTVRRVIVGTALAVTVEEDRWAKGKASLRGLFPR